jgi:WD40 repeat protein
VSGGCDKKVKQWTFKDGKFTEAELTTHDDWVRDVAWCNNIGLLHDTVATCSEDQKVKIL